MNDLSIYQSCSWTTISSPTHNSFSLSGLQIVMNIPKSGWNKIISSLIYFLCTYSSLSCSLKIFQWVFFIVQSFRICIDCFATFTQIIVLNEIYILLKLYSLSLCDFYVMTFKLFLSVWMKWDINDNVGGSVLIQMIRDIQLIRKLKIAAKFL